MTRLPPEEERRVLDELQAVITDCNDRDARLESDRIAALSTIPVAHTALAAYGTAVATAQTAQANADRTAERARDDAIELAARTEFDELTAVDQARQDVNLPSDRARAEAHAAAEDVFAATLQQIHAAGGTFVAQNAAERQAQAEREAAHARVDAAFAAAIRQADEAWESGQRAASRKRLESEQAAREQFEHQRVLNQRTFDDALQAAAAQFTATVQPDQASMAVESRFARDRAQLKAECEARKQALMTKLGGA